MSKAVPSGVKHRIVCSLILLLELTKSINQKIYFFALQHNTINITGDTYIKQLQNGQPLSYERLRVERSP